MRTSAIYFALLLNAGSAVGATADTRATFAGECFAIRGRLEQSNGSPSFRLWKVGTKRVFGVIGCNGKDEDDLSIPDNVKKIGGQYVSTSVFGDYEVCPFTKERQGWMQMVCIKSAAHLSAEK
jgi:hypothetical protein